MKTKQLPAGWKDVELGAIGEIVTGNTPPKNKIENYGGEIPWIKPSDLDKTIYVNSSEEYISETGRNEVRLLPKGAILVSCIGNIGKIAIASEEICTNQQINSIIPDKEKIISEYVYFYFKKFQKYFEDKANKAVVPILNKYDFSKLKILLPPLPTQKQIVSILEKAEQLKQKREQADKLTKEYLQSVFYEMFLKEKNKFPKIRLGDIFEIVRGGSPRPIEEYITQEKNGINWIKIGDTKGDSKYIYKTEEKIKPEGLKKSRLVKKGDFILSNSMSFGRPYILRTEGCIHDGWLLIRDINKKTNENYLYSILISEYVNSQFVGSVSGSTVKNLNIDLVKKVQIPLPPLSLQQKFAKIVEHVEKLKEKQKQSKEEIDNLFNSLMQKAFNGELVR